MLKPSNAIFTIVSFATLLSFTGYTKGDKDPYIMYVFIFLIILMVIYSASFIIRCFEEKIELKSIALAFFGLMYSIAMNPFVSIFTFLIFIHLFLFTPLPSKTPNIDESMGKFVMQNLKNSNKIILVFYTVIISFLLLSK